MAYDPKPVATYRPNKETIGQLLSMTNPSIVVPDWQRNYSWKAEQIDTFWNDLEAFFLRQQKTQLSEYFLGSVVIVNTSDGNLKLLDGQQRLATSAILLSCIRDKVKEFNNNAALQLQTEYLVKFDHVHEKTIHKLRLNIYDRDFFRQLILDERVEGYKVPEPKIASHHQILNARKKFEQYLENFAKGLVPKKTFELCMALSKCLLSQMTVISVYSSDEESAADVFETLNDRGIGLSTPDLLRNLVIRRAVSGQQDTVVELWRDLISFASDTQIKNFLRHYWVSRYGDVKTQSLYREIKGVIQEKDLESVALSTSLSQSSEIYRQLVDGTTSSTKFNRLLNDVLDYGSRARILLPTFLALVEELGADEAVEAARVVINVFVRHSIIRNLENSPFESAMYEGARDFRNDKDLDIFLSRIIAVSPSDKSVTDAFTSLSVVHNGSRRNILKQFELNARKTEELDIAGSSRVHVEHVYPQKPLPGSRLPNHEKIINRLGNLTLLSASINKALQNGTFADKRALLATSEILITREIASSAHWDEASIISRQAKMAELAPSLWPVQI